MQDETPPRPAQECVGAATPFAPSSDNDQQRPGQKIFRLDVHTDDVALMVRYRHEANDDTQVHIWASVGSIGMASSPPGYVIDSVDVVGTRWDGQSSGGMHRVVCLLARKPDERSSVRFLIVVDQGDAIAIPPADSDIRHLNDFSLVYAPGEVLLPP